MSSRGAYYVVAHGTWRVERKKKPSAVFANIRNPRLAFEIAKQITQEMDTTGIYTTREIHFTLESLEKEVTDLGFKISYLLGGDSYIVARMMGVDGKTGFYTRTGATFFIQTLSIFKKGTRIRVAFPQ